MAALPFDGIFKQGQAPRKKELVLFVHHYGGSAKTTRRHGKLVNSLGYDSFHFSLPNNPILKGNKRKAELVGFILEQLRLGLDRIWGRSVLKVLNHFEDREIIIYSFSSPSFGALYAMAHFRHKNQIKGWICDGGPFFSMWKSFWNYFGKIEGIHNPILKGLASTGTFALWGGPNLSKKSNKYMAALPKNFPVLSIRGSEDPLVPSSAIEMVFEHHNQLALKRHIIQGGGHLDGLKQHPDQYQPIVEKFLGNISAQAK